MTKYITIFRIILMELSQESSFGYWQSLNIQPIRLIFAQKLIKQVAEWKEIDVLDALILVYNSFISEKIDDYNSSMYYENPSYLLECFVENKVI